MSGAGNGSPKKATLQTFQVAIRWVFNMGEGTRLDDFVWKPAKYEIVVYRGQSSSSSKAIERRGKNPTKILTNLKPPKPIATSKLLSQKIVDFSTPSEENEDPKSRIFEIHIQPGTPVCSMYDQIPKEFSLPFTNDKEELAAARERIAPLIDEAFSFLKEELPEDHGLKDARPAQLYGFFFNILHKEKELLLDPRRIQFVQEDGSLERDWNNEEVPAVVYKIDSRGDKVKKKKKKEKKGKKGAAEEEVPDGAGAGAGTGAAAAAEEFETLGEVPVYRTFVVPKEMEGGSYRKTRKNRRRKE
jgi:hypothetical protein